MGFVDMGTYSWGSTSWVLFFYKRALTTRWEADGLRVVESHPVPARDIKIRLKSKKIYRYAFMGHGGWGGFLEGSDNSVVLADTYTRYGISEMHLITCYSNSGADKWKKNVSEAGFLKTVRGLFSGSDWALGSMEYVKESGTR